ncbi:MAG: metallophosphoesterase, partial [Pigmentiphaga sp.]
MFHVFAGLLALYVLWRLVWCLNWSWRAKCWVSAIVLVATQSHLVNRMFFGSMASPEVSGAVIMMGGWAFGSLLIGACLLVVVDLASLVIQGFAWCLRQSRSVDMAQEAPDAPGAGRTARLLGAAAGLPESVGSSRPAHGSRRGLGLRWAVVVAAMLLAAMGVREAVRLPDVRTVEIVLPGLPSGLDGFRLVQLTDLHASRLLQQPWVEAVVEAANALKPDLIVLTGDLADGSVQARASDVEPLRKLTAPQGVYAIPGNHEYYTEYRRWLDRLRELDLRLLLNEHVVLETLGGNLVLAGVTDPAAARFGEPLPDVAAALAGAAEKGPVILLSHRPTGAAAHAQAGASLQLSGHTHGGQIAGLHWITQWANEGYVSGLYDVGAMRLYVSHGAGLWNGLPLRVGRPSEITEIILRAR